MTFKSNEVNYIIEKSCSFYLKCKDVFIPVKLNNVMRMRKLMMKFILMMIAMVTTIVKIIVMIVITTTTMVNSNFNPVGYKPCRLKTNTVQETNYRSTRTNDDNKYSS